MNKAKSILTLPILLLGIFLFAENLEAANRIFSFDFESGTAADVFYTNSGTNPPNYVGIVNDNCYAGSGCLRGNFFEGQNDPVTGLAGENDPHINIGGTTGMPGYGTYHNFYNAHANELYVSFWYRVDRGANHRRGPLAPISSCSPSQDGASKILYFSSTGGMNQTYNNRYISSFSRYQNAGMSESGHYVSTDIVTDGVWRHIEIYVQYETSIGAGNGVWRLWEDGRLIWNDSAVNFRVSGDRFRSFAIAQFTGGACASTGYAYDNIEIWDGMPSSDTTPPSAPGGLVIQ